MKRLLTAEQQAKRDERKTKFKALWKQVSEMAPADRVNMSVRYGFMNTEGKTFSTCNSMLIALQCPGASVLGGFRQWIKQGRCVRKGEHGLMIWVPVGGRKETNVETGVTSTDTQGERPGFVIGTIFDIGQTVELGAETVEAVETIPTAPVEVLQLQAA